MLLEKKGLLLENNLGMDEIYEEYVALPERLKMAEKEVNKRAKQAKKKK